MTKIYINRFYCETNKLTIKEANTRAISECVQSIACPGDMSHTRARTSHTCKSVNRT